MIAAAKLAGISVAELIVREDMRTLIGRAMEGVRE